MLEVLHNLSDTALRALAASLRNGPLAVGLSRHSVAQVTGSEAGAVLEVLEALRQQGMSPVHTALMLDAIAQAREVRSGQMLFDLVLSGPEVPGVPTADTAATVQTLIEGAQREVLLVGYAVHNGKRLFKRLAERMEAVPDLRVVFCLDIARKPADTSLESEIVWRFAREFVTKHWPGKRFPQVFYDPRALAETWEGRASLHAKCVIVDRSAALVTSANFTAAAQKKNIEVGVLIRHEATVGRLAGYFEALRQGGLVRECQLA